MKHKGIILLSVLVILASIAAFITFRDFAVLGGRAYLADISLPLEDGSAEIIIKEWRFLLGSGAEIYYKQDGKLTLLGTTTGGDDGYCPFAAGKYTLEAEEDALIIRWHFDGDIWKDARFSLPEK